MPNSNKIAVICNYRLLPERVGGMDRFYWQFDKACKVLGHEVIWFFPNHANHGDYSQFHIIAHQNKDIEQSFLDEHQSFDVVFTHFVEICTSFFKKIKHKNRNAKVIVVDHNPRPYDGYPILKKIRKRIKGILYSRFIDLFIGVSAYTIHELIKDFGHQIKPKCQVIYNGIETPLYKKKTNRKTSKPTFLVVSHLRLSKGIQDLIQAVVFLPNEIKKETTIDIYGEGPYEIELKKQIKYFGLDNQFTFKGSVSNLYDLYANYDYMLQPTHMECFSLSILESLCANVPVVTTPVGGNLEVITHQKNGYIFPAKNALLLSQIIENLYLGNFKIEEDISLDIREKFNITNMINKYVNLIS